ncbi:MAG: MBL fold metallo-hydrolase [Polyangiaceae bacterium]
MSDGFAWPSPTGKRLHNRWALIADPAYTRVVKISVLASGSAGNCSLYESGNTRVIVDAGIGPRKLAKKLKEVGCSGPISGIVITHAHSDHVGHAEKLARATGAPLFMSEATSRHVSMPASIDTREFHAREPFEIGGLVVSPLPLPHDAAQVALVLSDGSRSAAIATDLGEVPPGLVDHVGHCDVLLIESNHDVDMLARGPYPDYLKRRILSAKGHISNEQTREFLKALPRGVKRTVVLMHLSETNNTPELAKASALEVLRSRKTELHIASQEGTLTLATRMSQLALPFG